MVTIYKIIDGVESEVLCTTQEGAEAMVKSNPEKYSLTKKIKSDGLVKNDEELLKEIEALKNEKIALETEVSELKAIIKELESGTLPAGVTVESGAEDPENEAPADGE